MRKIVLTGGPCAGKTSVLEALKERFGAQVTFVPEVATILLGNGFPVPGKDLEYDEACDIAFQKVYGTAQLSLEYLHERIAEREGHKLMVCDRGLWDGAAYARIAWEDYAKLLGVDFSELEDRYHMVIHLHTLAISNPELYQTSNNGARYESVEKAKLADQKVRDGYKRHPAFLKLRSDIPSLTTKVKAVADIIQGQLYEL